MKKLILLMVGVAVLTCLGCSKGKAVSDPGPQFSVGSSELKINLNENNVVPLRRDDSNSGPQIQIQFGDPSSIVSVERKLLCGSILLQGKKALAGDPTLFNFRMGEEEFPGLNQMPSRAPCKLTIAATNNAGSISTKNTTLTLSFDKNPALEVVRHVVTGGLNPHNSKFEVPLENYVIKNNFSYSVGITFTPRREFSAHMKYHYTAGDGGNPWQDLYNKDLISLSITRIEISGSITQQFGDLSHELRFVIPPGETVNLTSFAQIPSDLTRKQRFTSWGFGGGLAPEHHRAFLGAYVVSISDPKPYKSFALWRGFEPTPSDISDPAYVDFKDELPFPGVQIDNEVMGHLMAD